MTYMGSLDAVHGIVNGTHIGECTHQCQVLGEITVTGLTTLGKSLKRRLGTHIQHDADG